MNGDVHITGGTFYQGKPQEEKEKEEEKTPQATSEASTSAKPPKRRNLKPLFPQADNGREENTVVRLRERARFLEYLRLHKMAGRTLTTLQGDTLNSIVASFLTVWREKGWIAKDFSGIAVYRFLHYECGIKSSIDPQTYANKITPWVKNKKYSIEMLAEVEEYMKTIAEE